ncbi:hypothetical protein SUGI_0712850 [Cryptomeria japonica]|nr:hypothetical protein SUGI_0712850 [Cryptomeria japonica]
MGSLALKATVTLATPACNSTFAHACILSVVPSAFVCCVTVFGVDASVAGAGGSFSPGVASFADFSPLPPCVGGVLGVGADCSAHTPLGFASCANGCTVAGVISDVGAGVSTSYGAVLPGDFARPFVLFAKGLDVDSVSVNSGAGTSAAVNIGEGVVPKPLPPAVGRSFTCVARSATASHKVDSSQEDNAADVREVPTPVVATLDSTLVAFDL